MTSEPHAHPLVPQYSDGLFKGTAEFYGRYRPQYPPVLVEAVLDQVTLEPGDRLLDLACGTGEVAMAFRDSFPEIWAIDSEAEMVEAGQRRAEEAGVSWITWSVSRAEDVDCPDDYFGVVAMGRAFHRVNRPLVAASILRWLRPHGYFVDLGIDTSGIIRPSEPWLALAGEVYERWLSKAARQREDKRSDANAGLPKATTQQVLIDAGYLGVEKFEFDVPHTWTLDAFVGYLYSTSYSSPDFWGASREAFEDDLRTTLLDYDPSGEYPETLSAYFVIGQAP